MSTWMSRLAKTVIGTHFHSRPDTRDESVIADGAIKYDVRAFMLSDIGCVRSINQDTVAYVCPGDAEERRRLGVLAVVADGMGGHQGGEVASALAVETICRNYFAARDSAPLRALERAVLGANGEVYRAAQADPQLAGMGTTVTALALVGTSALVVHIGDSRLYRCTDGWAMQLTDDDTLVRQMVEDGMITAEQARHHPDRGVLLCSLGTRPQVCVMARNCGTPQIGDCFVLCSDGLHESVAPHEIADAVASSDPEHACRHLIELARARDGTDNISVGVLAIRAADGMDRPGPTAADDA